MNHTIKIFDEGIGKIGRRGRGSDLGLNIGFK